MLADVGLIQVDEKNEKLMQFVENAQHPQKYPKIRLKKQSASTVPWKTLDGSGVTAALKLWLQRIMATQTDPTRDEKREK